MNSLITQIDEIIEERSLLKHPFYQMWTDGKLTFDSLAGYSKEYFQLVKSVPTFVGCIISQASGYDVSTINSHKKEEQEHIEPWIKFAGELGISEQELIQYNGLEKTQKAISELSALMSGSFESGSVVMYSIEKEIPKISQTKLEGLMKFYNLSNENATKYFKLHMEADVRHAAAWRNIIDNISHTDDSLNIARKSVSAQNLLLDSCYEKYCC